MVGAFPSNEAFRAELADPLACGLPYLEMMPAPNSRASPQAFVVRGNGAPYAGWSWTGQTFRTFDEDACGRRPSLVKLERMWAADDEGDDVDDAADDRYAPWAIKASAMVRIALPAQSGETFQVNDVIEVVQIGWPAAPWEGAMTDMAFNLRVSQLRAAEGTALLVPVGDQAWMKTWRLRCDDDGSLVEVNVSNPLMLPAEVSRAASRISIARLWRDSPRVSIIHLRARARPTYESPRPPTPLEPMPAQSPVGDELDSSPLAFRADVPLSLPLLEAVRTLQDRVARLELERAGLHGEIRSLRGELARSAPLTGGDLGAAVAVRTQRASELDTEQSDCEPTIADVSSCRLSSASAEDVGGAGPSSASPLPTSVARSMASLSAKNQVGRHARDLRTCGKEGRCRALAADHALRLILRHGFAPRRVPRSCRSGAETLPDDTRHRTTRTVRQTWSPVGGGAAWRSGQGKARSSSRSRALPGQRKPRHSQLRRWRCAPFRGSTQGCDCLLEHPVRVARAPGTCAYAGVSLGAAEVHGTRVVPAGFTLCTKRAMAYGCAMK